MKMLEAKPFDKKAENWKRENQLLISTVLAAGTSRQNRIGAHTLRSHWTGWFVFAAQTIVSCKKLALLVTKGFSSPNDTPKPRKNCEDGCFSTSLIGMKSCTVDRGCTPAPKDTTKLAVFFRFFMSLSFDISMKNSVQRWSSDFQGPIHVKVRKMALGSNGLSTLPLNYPALLMQWYWNWPDLCNNYLLTVFLSPLPVLLCRDMAPPL